MVPSLDVNYSICLPCAFQPAHHRIPNIYVHPVLQTRRPIKWRVLCPSLSILCAQVQKKGSEDKQRGRLANLLVYRRKGW